MSVPIVPRLNRMRSYFLIAPLLLIAMRRSPRSVVPLPVNKRHEGPEGSKFLPACHKEQRAANLNLWPRSSALEMCSLVSCTSACAVSDKGARFPWAIGRQWLVIMSLFVGDKRAQGQPPGAG